MVLWHPLQPRFSQSLELSREVLLCHLDEPGAFCAQVAEGPVTARGQMGQGGQELGVVSLSHGLSLSFPSPPSSLCWRRFGRGRARGRRGPRRRNCPTRLSTPSPHCVHALFAPTFALLGRTGFERPGKKFPKEVLEGGLLRGRFHHRGPAAARSWKMPGEHVWLNREL